MSPISRIKPGGLIVLATLNRTLKSLALAKVGAEYILRWLPPGTHDWNKFVSPEELTSDLRDLELTIVETRALCGHQRQLHDHGGVRDIRNAARQNAENTSALTARYFMRRKPLLPLLVA